MSTKQIIFIAIACFVLFTLGLAMGYRIAGQAHPTPIIIEQQSQEKPL